jgi:hypothetical protein
MDGAAPSERATAVRDGRARLARFAAEAQIREEMSQTFTDFAGFQHRFLTGSDEALMP